MGPGGIATIIAASALAVIALSIAYLIVRLGRLVDEAKATLASISSEVNPLIEEVTTTVQLVNGPLESFNRITKSAEKITTKFADTTEGFLDNNKTIMKVAGALLGATKLKKSASSTTRTRRKSKTDSE